MVPETAAINGKESFVDEKITPMLMHFLSL
jgi:hypothetical protein